MAEDDLPILTEEDLNLQPLSSRFSEGSNEFCFLCRYTGQDDDSDLGIKLTKHIDTINNIVLHLLPLRSMREIVDTIHDLYTKRIRPFIQNTEDNTGTEWTRDAIRKHFKWTDTSIELAQKKDQQTIVHLLQYFRDNMIDENTNQIYAPNVTFYLKTRPHLDKIISTAKEYK